MSLFLGLKMHKLLLVPYILISLLCSCKLFNSNSTVTLPNLPKQPVNSKIYRPLPKDSLNNLLIAEFAERRGQFDLALNNYVSEAKKTKDIEVIKRTYQIAHYLNNDHQQLNMALLWVFETPYDIDANRAAAIELIKNDRNNEAMIYLLKVLASSQQLDFLNIANNNLSKKAHQNLISSLDNLLITHPNNVQLIYSKTILLTEIGANEQALTSLQTLPKDQQQLSAIVLLKVYLLQNIGKPNEALYILQEHIKNDTHNKELRLSYAQQLINQGKLVEAKHQFAELIKQYPDEEELRFGYALICIENKEWDEAIKYLKEMISNGIDSDNIYFYLASAYNEKGDKESAFYNYTLVKSGENHLLAIINSAKILFDKKQYTEAKQLLIIARKQNPEYDIALYLFEIEQLININYIDQAWQLVNSALINKPNNTDLLYCRSIVAERSNDLRQAEKDLRYIIKLQPNNATAINALGYILVNRTTRYNEALTLIQQAFNLDPGSPAILDSLGWVNYKLGNLVTALNLLQQAYAKYPDPEVAAHLGEVYWQQGQQQQAKTIWLKALNDNPKNTPLMETIFRLTGKKDL